MKFTPPKQITFWIAVVLAVLGLIGSLVSIPFISGAAFWLVFIAFALLVASLFVKGL